MGKKKTDAAPSRCFVAALRPGILLRAGKIPGCKCITPGAVYMVEHNEMFGFHVECDDGRGHGLYEHIDEIVPTEIDGFTLVEKEGMN